VICWNNMRLSVGFLDDKYGEAYDLNGVIYYEGPEADVIKDMVEDHHRKKPWLQGEDLLLEFHNSPMSYVWSNLK
jgi:hypothetical protein